MLLSRKPHPLDLPGHPNISWMGVPQTPTGSTELRKGKQVMGGYSKLRVRPKKSGKMREGITDDNRLKIGS